MLKPLCLDARWKPRRTMLVALAAAHASLLPACSSQQLYGTGQNWQRQECVKLPDIHERNRCMASANRSYEDYQRESQAGTATR